MIRQFFAATEGPLITGDHLWLKLAWGAYRGDRLAIYCYNNRNDEGYVDVDYFHYKYSK